MSVLAATTFARRRQRAGELRARYSFAGAVLTLYEALLDVQEAAVGGRPPAEDLAGWASLQILPGVVEATIRVGPPLLAGAVRGRLTGCEPAQLLLRWLADGELEPIDRYLARASLSPCLEAWPEWVAVCAGTRAEGRCPDCGALPQLSWTAPSGDPLVAGRRHLLCSRCHRSWTAARCCPSCGERDGARLPVFGERAPAGVLDDAGGVGEAVLPQLRIESCERCNSYLVHVDLTRDHGALPEVDELAAIPLDLYAQERGLRKITPNLMGF